MSIRAVYFDLGGVILRTEDKAPRTELAESLRLTYEAVERVVHGGGPDGSAAQAALGLITEEQHWLNVVRALNLPESEIPRVENAYFAGDRLDQTLLDFMRLLRPNVKVGLISNAWFGLRAWIANQKFDDAFDHMTISAEVGLAKPDARIYQHALEKLGVHAEEAIFIDDMPANIDAAKVLGMQGVVFQEAEQAITEIKRLLTGLNNE
jgi:epoxide hydrolase-like predicted phosphatase